MIYRVATVQFRIQFFQVTRYIKIEDETCCLKKVTPFKELLCAFLYTSPLSDPTEPGWFDTHTVVCTSLLPPIHHSALAWQTQPPPPPFHWDDACLSRSRCSLPHLCVRGFCFCFVTLVFCILSVRDLLFVVSLFSKYFFLKVGTVVYGKTSWKRLFLERSTKRRKFIL